MRTYSIKRQHSVDICRGASGCFLAGLLLFTLLFGRGVSGGATESISYIEDLVGQGRKVAVVLIDMQTGFMSRYMQSEFVEVVSEQNKLLSHFEENMGVEVIDVNYYEHGPTLSEHLQSLKKKVLYKLFFKREDGAIRAMSAEDTPGEPSQLDAFLTSRGIQEVFVTGCFEGACVYRTVRDFLRRGFKVTIDRKLNIIGDVKDSAGRSSEEMKPLNQEKWQSLKKEFETLTEVPPLIESYCDI